METAIQQNAPSTDQGFAASAPVQTSDMQQAMQQEHGGGEQVQQPGQTEGLYAGKYQSVEALVDGYKNLQTSYDARYGGFTGSPENDYEYTPHADLAESEFKLDKTSDTMQRFNSLAKELNMSQDSYNHILNLFTHEMNTQGTQSAHDTEIAEQESYDNYIADLGGNEEAVHQQTEDMIRKIGRVPEVTDEGIMALVGDMKSSLAFTTMQLVIAGGHHMEYSTVPGSAGTATQQLTDSYLQDQLKAAMGMTGQSQVDAMKRVNDLFAQKHPGMRES